MNQEATIEKIEVITPLGIFRIFQYFSSLNPLESTRFQATVPKEVREIRKLTDKDRTVWKLSLVPDIFVIGFSPVLGEI